MLLVELLLVISVVGLILVSGMAALNAVWHSFDRAAKTIHISAESKLLESQIKRAWQRRINTLAGQVRVTGEPVARTGEVELLEIGWTYVDNNMAACALKFERIADGSWRLTSGETGGEIRFNRLGRIFLREFRNTDGAEFTTLEFSFPDIGDQTAAGFAIHEFW